MQSLQAFRSSVKSSTHNVLEYGNAMLKNWIGFTEKDVDSFILDLKEMVMREEHDVARALAGLEPPYEVLEEARKKKSHKQKRKRRRSSAQSSEEPTRASVYLWRESCHPFLIMLRVRENVI